MGFSIKRGGETQPFFKYDGRFGRFKTVDKIDGQPVEQDVTDGLVCVLDLANMEQGHIRFPKKAPPQTVLFPMDATEDEVLGSKPDGEGWALGLRVRVKLPGEDQWRELLSTTIGLWNALGALHDAYLARADLRAALPIVSLDEVLQHVGKNGMVYEPVFGIVGHIAPDDVLSKVKASELLERKKPSQPKPEATAKSAPKRSDMDDEVPF